MSYGDILIRLMVAVFVGGLIGYEREYKQRPAGLRTHILVCVGAAVVSMIQISIGEWTILQTTINPALSEVFKVDYGRLGAQVITGVGFLGAGTIVHLKGSVKGLTTAATVWTVACLGLAVGLGFYFLSLAATFIIFITLIIFKKLEGKIIYKKKNIKLYVEFDNGIEGNKQLCQYFEKEAIEVLTVSMDMENEENKNFKFEYYINVPAALTNSSLICSLGLIEEVLSFKLI